MATCKITLNTVLHDLLELVAQTKLVIDQFFPPLKATAPYISKLSYSIQLPPVMYTMLVYIDLYPNRKFDQMSQVDLNNLKDIYLSLNLKWQDNPFLINGIKLGIVSA